VQRSGYKERAARQLGQVCRLLRRHGCSLLNEIGLHQGQHFVIEAVARVEGMTQSELAAAVSVQPATMTHMLQHMERAGLIERRPDERDQRLSRVFLTDAGRAAWEQVETVWQRIGQMAFAGFADDECEMVQDLLGRVQANLASEECVPMDRMSPTSAEDSGRCETQDAC